MKKYIRLGWYMFLNNVRLNSLQIVQITLTILVGCYMISLFSIIGSSRKALSKLLDSNFAYYMDSDEVNYHLMRSYEDHSHESGQFDDEQDVHFESENGTEMVRKGRDISGENLSNVLFRAKSFSTDGQIGESALQIIAYDPGLIDYVHMPMRKGRFVTSTRKGSVVEAVVGEQSDYRVGSKYKLMLYGVDSNGELKEKETEILIVGKYCEPAQILQTNGVSMVASSSVICDIVSKKTDGIDSIILCTNEIDDFIPYFFNQSNNEYIVFDEDIKQSVYESNVDKLQELGIVATTTSIKMQDDAEIINTLKTYLPLLVFLSILSFAGIVGISIINMRRYLRMFAIYFLCGCTWDGCKRIVLVYLAMMGGVLLGASAFCLWLMNRSAFLGFVLTNGCFRYALLIVAMFFLVSLITPLWMLHNKTPLDARRMK